MQVSYVLDSDDVIFICWKRHVRSGIQLHPRLSIGFPVITLHYHVLLNWLLLKQNLVLQLAIRKVHTLTNLVTFQLILYKKYRIWRIQMDCTWNVSNCSKSLVSKVFGIWRYNHLLFFKDLQNVHQFVVSSVFSLFSTLYTFSTRWVVTHLENPFLFLTNVSVAG